MSWVSLATRDPGLFRVTDIGSVDFCTDTTASDDCQLLQNNNDLVFTITGPHGGNTMHRLAIAAASNPAVGGKQEVPRNQWGNITASADEGGN